MSNHIQNRHSCNIKTNNSNNSENVFRYSYPNSRPGILHTKFDIPIKKSTIKRLSNKSVDSQDSGIGLSKADYEIRRAIKAQRIIERPQIIVIHKGKPIMTSRNNYNNSNSEDLDADAHMIISAATASKIHRREIAFTRSNDIETNDIKKEIDNYDEKKKPRGCSFLKSKPSIKRVSSVIKKLVGKEKRFMTCVYVN
nr:6199_t:CDS:2 [Entrophospora candida]CAG8452644.1 10363_t:CDS:2 [Entrophospora candida]